MEAGIIRDSGSTPSIVRDYLNDSLSNNGSLTHLVQSRAVTLKAVRVLSASESQGSVLMRGDPLKIEVEFVVTNEVPGLDLAMFVTRSGGIRVLDEMLSDRSDAPLSPGHYRVSMVIPPLLNVGEHSAGVWFGTQYDDEIDLPLAAPFTIHGSDLDRPQRTVVLELPFVVERLDTAS
jgi:hypothetical protein